MVTTLVMKVYLVFQKVSVCWFIVISGTFSLNIIQCLYEQKNVIFHNLTSDRVRLHVMSCTSK